MSYGKKKIQMNNNKPYIRVPAIWADADIDLWHDLEDLAEAGCAEKKMGKVVFWPNKLLEGKIIFDVRREPVEVKFCYCCENHKNNFLRMALAKHEAILERQKRGL